MHRSTQGDDVNMGTGYSVLGIGLQLELRIVEFGLVIVDFGINRLERPNYSSLLYWLLCKDNN